MERNEIIKALECCANGGWCSRDGCPFYKDDEFGDVEKCTSELTKNALALIKELNQANEQLSESYDHLEKTKDELLSERSRLTEENESLYQSCTNLERKCARLDEALDRGIAWMQAMNTNHIEGIKILKDLRDRIRADTVREMHSMLCEGRVSNDNVVIVANQIAKEMLEGEG